MFDAPLVPGDDIVVEGVLEYVLSQRNQAGRRRAEAEGELRERHAQQMVRVARAGPTAGELYAVRALLKSRKRLVPTAWPHTRELRSRSYGGKNAK